jgi:hypothetical protein
LALNQGGDISSEKSDWGHGPDYKAAAENLSTFWQGN